jgi:hypothetical protein
VDGRYLGYNAADNGKVFGFYTKSNSINLKAYDVNSVSIGGATDPTTPTDNTCRSDYACRSDTDHTNRTDNTYGKRRSEDAFDS